MFTDTVALFFMNAEHIKDFGINDATELDTLQLPYDFISIMHYDKLVSQLIDYRFLL